MHKIIKRAKAKIYRIHAKVNGNSRAIEPLTL